MRILAMLYKNKYGLNANYSAGIIGSLAITILLISSTVTQAASYYWNVSSGDWSTADYWGGTEPASGDDACIQNGGKATITEPGELCYNLYLGTSKSETIEMTGGGLSVWKSSYVGNSGTGTFKQSGGTNTISSSLYLGFYSGSSGTYILSEKSELSAYDEHIGEFGTGTFTQTGGTNSTSYLFLGIYADAVGKYNLSDTGNLSAYELIGYSGTGTIAQIGGTNSSSYLFLGVNSKSSGIYNLSGAGQLSAVTEFVGYYGTGTFTQNSGTNTISSYLSLACDSGSIGTYKLNGGTLILKSLGKGSGTAEFDFGGGTLQACGDFNTSLHMTLTSDGGNANIDSAGYAVTLSGVLSGVGGLNKLGSGMLTISNTANYAGNTTVGGGTLFFSGGIAAGGTSLIDVESGTAVLKTTNVSKSDLDIFTAASAKFEVADHTHLVGDITGSGTTQVDSGASLTAASISQGTLTISSGATVTIQTIPGGPLSDTITAVPEPSTLALLVAVFLIPAYSRARRWIK
jgi:autotransporter-associated beta strand protein